VHKPRAAVGVARPWWFGALLVPRARGAGPSSRARARGGSWRRRAAAPRGRVSAHAVEAGRLGARGPCGGTSGECTSPATTPDRTPAQGRESASVYPVRGHGCARNRVRMGGRTCGWGWDSRLKIILESWERVGLEGRVCARIGVRADRGRGLERPRPIKAKAKEDEGIGHSALGIRHSAFGGTPAPLRGARGWGAMTGGAAARRPPAMDPRGSAAGKKGRSCVGRSWCEVAARRSRREVVWGGGGEKVCGEKQVRSRRGEERRPRRRGEGGASRR
jgi:hypothetical protein